MPKSTPSFILAVGLPYFPEERQSMQLFLLAVIQCVCIIWLHHRAVATNLHRLRRHIARQPPQKDGFVWLHMGPNESEYALCSDCVDTLMILP